MRTERYARSCLALSCLLAVLLLCIAPPCSAQTATTPELAPLNPVFKSYLEQAAANRTQSLPDEGYGLGAIPAPVDLSHIKTVKPAERQLAGFPASYDLRTFGKVTSVKNQTTCGSCWAFASLGSMESCLLPGETWDFSENNLKNLTGFDIACCDGGNQYMSTAYLARWAGPVDDASDPHNPASCTSPAGLPVRKHLQDVIFLPNRSGFTDNDAIKQAVMTYGAVYTTFYWNSGYYNSSTASFYYNGGYTLNHAVCIVGWDDNYPRTNFLTQPAGDGAFLIKNSWGTGWGLGGYFYLSYYDTTVGNDNTVFDVSAPATNYDRIYQYDPLGWVNSVGYGGNTAWGANVFTSAANGQVMAASFYAASPGTSCEAYVHLSPDSGPINTSGYAAIKTGTVADAGFHTIVFDTPVGVASGQKFSIVMKLTTPGYNWPIPMEYPQTGYSGAATAGPGQSYISYDGNSWSDLTSIYSNTNACIKAYVGNTLGLVVSPSSGLAASGPAGGPMGPSITYTLSNTSFQNANWAADKTQPWVSLSAAGGTLAPGANTQVTVSINSVANALPDGVYADTVSFTNTSTGEGDTTRPVTLDIKSPRLSVGPAGACEIRGFAGGPFGAVSNVYTLTNTGYGALSWMASADEPWIGLSSSSGILGPGQQAVVEVSADPAANSLPVGDYAGTVTFANAGNGLGDCARDANLSVRTNYDIVPVTLNWVDPSTHAVFPLGDNSATAAQALPFLFTLYGVQYDQVYVGSNGLITLGSSDGATSAANTDIPSTQPPNAAIYPYWDDLYPYDGGEVRIGTTGLSPNRRFVVSWVNVPRFGDSSVRISCQAILCETSNDITFQYLDVTPADLVYGAGRSATVGVEDETGLLARKHSFDGSTLLANNQAFTFTTNRELSLPEAKRHPNGWPVILRGGVVTGVFSSIFYIEQDDRSSGISVYKTGHGVTVGTRVDVAGTLSTNASGERYIAATSVTPVGTGTIGPMLLANRAIGGSDWEYDAVTGAGQKGVKGAYDLNNIGMLVCTAGKVTYVGTNYFYVDDGSKAKDNSAYKGVKVSATGLTLPGLNKFVKVCGISSCSKSGADLYRLIRATSITVMNP